MMSKDQQQDPDPESSMQRPHAMNGLSFLRLQMFKKREKGTKKHKLTMRQGHPAWMQCSRFVNSR